MENYGSLLHNYLLKSREVSRLWSCDLNTSLFKGLLAPQYFLLFFLIFVLFFSAHWHCTPYWACLSFFWFIYPIATPLSASSYLLCLQLPPPAVFSHSWWFARAKPSIIFKDVGYKIVIPFHLRQCVLSDFSGAFLGNTSKWNSADFQVLVSKGGDNWFF